MATTRNMCEVLEAIANDAGDLDDILRDRFESFATCVEHGLVLYSDEPTLTATGQRALTEYQDKKRAQRAHKNAYSRARSAAARSVGLRRTTSGWE